MAANLMTQSTAMTPSLQLRTHRIVLTSLPNELLLSILLRIPNLDQHLCLQLVCSRLAQLSALACDRRRSLKFRVRIVGPPLTDQIVPRHIALLHKLTHLSLMRSPAIQLERLGNFLSPQLLCNLEKLTVQWLIRHPLVHLIRALGPLTQDVTASKLTNLVIFFGTDDPAFQDHSRLNLSELVERTGLGGTVATCPLRSIKSITLNFKCPVRAHDEIALLWLHRICTNVVYVQVYIQSGDLCRECEETNSDPVTCRECMVGMCCFTALWVNVNQRMVFYYP